MTGDNYIGYRSVLVVEDEYYLATDTARALRAAGVEVIGPCRSEEAARAEIAARRPDAVVVDINLGTGPSFGLARTLRDRGIPFLFFTGYDGTAIPDEFREIDRLEKPVQRRHLVEAISKLLGSPTAKPADVAKCARGTDPL